MGASASASALNEQGAKALDELSGAGPLDASNPAWNVLLGSQHKLHVADAGAIQESIAKAAKDLIRNGGASGNLGELARQAAARIAGVVAQGRAAAPDDVIAAVNSIVLVRVLSKAVQDERGAAALAALMARPREGAPCGTTSLVRALVVALAVLPVDSMVCTMTARPHGGMGVSGKLYSLAVEAAGLLLVLLSSHLVSESAPLAGPALSWPEAVHAMSESAAAGLGDAATPAAWSWPAAEAATRASLTQHPFWELVMAAGDATLADEEAHLRGMAAPSSAPAPAPPTAAPGGAASKSASAAEAAAAAAASRAQSRAAVGGALLAALLGHAAAMRDSDSVVADGDIDGGHASAAATADASIRARCAGVSVYGHKAVSSTMDAPPSASVPPSPQQAPSSSSSTSAAAAASQRDLLDVIIDAGAAIARLPSQLMALVMAEGTPSPRPLAQRAAALLLLLVHAHRRRSPAVEAADARAAASSPDVARRTAAASATADGPAAAVPGRAVAAGARSPTAEAAACTRRAAVNPYRLALQLLHDPKAADFAASQDAARPPPPPPAAAVCDAGWCATALGAAVTTGGDVGVLLLYTALYVSPALRASLTASASGWVLPAFGRLHELSEGGEASRPGAQSRRVVAAVTCLLASQAGRMVTHLNSADGGGDHSPQWLCRGGMAGGLPLVGSARVGAIMVIVLARAARACLRGNRASQEGYTLTNLCAALSNSTAGLVDCHTVAADAMAELFVSLAKRASRAVALARAPVAAPKVADPAAAGAAAAGGSAAAAAAGPGAAGAADAAAARDRARRLESYAASLAEELLVVAGAVRACLGPRRLSRNLVLLYALLCRQEEVQAAAAAAAAGHPGWPAALKEVTAELARLVRFTGGSLQARMRMEEDAAGATDEENAVAWLGDAVRSWEGRRGAVPEAELAALEEEARGAAEGPAAAAAEGAAAGAESGDTAAPAAAPAGQAGGGSGAAVVPGRAAGAAADEEAGGGGGSGSGGRRAPAAWSAGWEQCETVAGGFSYDEEGEPERFFVPRAWAEAMAATGDLGWRSSAGMARLLPADEVADAVATDPVKAAPAPAAEEPRRESEAAAAPGDAAAIV
ncbi:hypothetical protein FNF31_04238 [Cafeteria roenbergensis]|uniref:Dymeclin n=1 Tax=Cafeteria roenbergensis TaxID=33653 RepID=A0A5A8D6H6_CAFRO|nr:hypothetical protein FNF31_04238 [Cafeteria roenbergensis]